MRGLWDCDASGRVVEITHLSTALLSDPMNHAAVRDRILARAR